MILRNDNDKLNVVIKFRVDGFSYTIFAMTEAMKCFGQEGHPLRSCIKNGSGARGSVCSECRGCRR